MYTDMHSHVIWGVDDGAKDREETWDMLREAVNDGISRIICTPHITPGVYPFPQDVFDDHFEQALAFIRKEKLPLSLYKGAELLYTDLTPRLLREGKVPTLAGSRYALIEFSPSDKADHITDALQKVTGAGFVPIIAHMERYPAIGKIRQAEEMKTRYHALIQINGRTLLRKAPLLRRGFQEELFRRGLVDFIATDTHALPGRETCMTPAMEVLKDKYGTVAASAIRQRVNILFDE
ncbi:MAG: hypothetical protein IJJ42_08725 [Clostridia bacterium]|nr:hypothetical protein [Clostridia bacterium]